MKKQIIAALVLGISVGSLNILTKAISVRAQTNAVTPGRQCIFNNGAFSLNVDWYNPGSVVFKGQNAAEAKDYSKYEISGQPAETKNNVTLGVSSCTEGANRVGVVRIVGGKYANDAISYAAGTGTGILTGVAGAFLCVGTIGVGCVAGIAGATAATGAVQAATAKLPDVQEIVYIGSPGTQNYVDLSGTIWQVGVANNIPLTNSRGFDQIAKFFTGGEPGPRSISFKNEAGYVAEMSVLYFQKKDVGGGNVVELPVVQSSGQISVGRTVHINVPLAISNQPIQVFIKGVATLKSDVFSTTVPAKFSGNKCYKAFGTIFNAQGSSCS